MKTTLGALAVCLGISFAVWALFVYRGPKSPFPPYMDEYASRLVSIGGIILDPLLWTVILAAVAVSLLVTGAILILK